MSVVLAKVHKASSTSPLPCIMKARISATLERSFIYIAQRKTTFWKTNINHEQCSKSQCFHSKTQSNVFTLAKEPFFLILRIILSLFRRPNAVSPWLFQWYFLISSRFLLVVFTSFRNTFFLNAVWKGVWDSQGFPLRQVKYLLAFCFINWFQFLILQKQFWCKSCIFMPWNSAFPSQPSLFTVPKRAQLLF